MKAGVFVIELKGMKCKECARKLIFLLSHSQINEAIFKFMYYIRTCIQVVGVKINISETYSPKYFPCVICLYFNNLIRFTSMVIILPVIFYETSIFQKQTVFFKYIHLKLFNSSAIRESFVIIYKVYRKA